MLTVLCEACLEPMTFKGLSELNLLNQNYVVCHMCNYESLLTEDVKDDIRRKWGQKL